MFESDHDSIMLSTILTTNYMEQPTAKFNPCHCLLHPSSFLSHPRSTLNWILVMDNPKCTRQIFSFPTICILDACVCDFLRVSIPESAIMQGVTLGGTGKEIGDRHPKIGQGALIGASATILGNITIGEGAMIAAGSLVLKDVPPHR